MDSSVLLIYMAVLFGAFYFLFIRPQKKAQKEHKQLLDNLKVYDRVLTAGGMYGTITEVGTEIVTLQVAEGVQVEYAKSAILRVVEKE
ncbi:preprotein translocase subunit YajC [Heliobacillus mobilis]|uniref:Preprotein translocase subunit YajC n=2 Tax=Heliobacterium TaxID=2697 RepID=A0A6I3SL95_HELMO|nr:MULTISPECIES: preprotein translocase subunit YajC [Heliobacterium]MBC9785660.1 preprotein translocase subunit YajC [Heliobacterium chlorum]MTV49711.1 preprotein translocase subunit YajC [Heliobacterium mobile]